MLRRPFQTATLTAVALLALAAPLAARTCSKEARMSCADGLQWNPDTKACETLSG